jgi:hypothetical protein
MFSFLKGENMNCAYPDIRETLPASTLGYQTNNRFQHFPPKMADGRSILSTWRPESFMNDELIKINNIQSNWQYRRYIQNNANEIIKQNQLEALNDTGYYKCDPIPETTYNQLNGPKRFASLHEISPTETDSDLKELYLSRERLDSRKIAPEITQAELLEKYGVPLRR